MINFQFSMKCITFITLIIFISIIFPSKAIAQEVSLGISPTVIQIEAKPPASITTPITIENNGLEPVQLQVVFKAFTASSKENGHVQYYSDKDPMSRPTIFGNIQLLENDHVRDTITLAPEQKKTLGLHIGIPKNQPLDDHYFSVIFVVKDPAKRSEKSASQTPAGIATNVLLSIGPKGGITAEIEEFRTALFLDHGPVPFTVRLKNKSDHMITPRGEILITNMFGQMIGRVDLLPVNILARTTRAIPDGLQNPEASGSSELVIDESAFPVPQAWWHESFLLGPYTAQLTMAMSDKGPVFRRTIYFFALPWTVLVSIMIGIIIIIYIGLKVRRRLRQKI